MKAVVAALLIACGSSSTTNSITVVLIAPEGTITTREIEATFTSADGVTFTCTMDGTTSPCTSPARFIGLQDGSHTLVVTGTRGKLLGEATATWVVDATPPVVTFTAPPAAMSVDVISGQLAFSCSKVGCAFTCSLDGAAAAACASPLDYAVSGGMHTFTVVATDANGLTGSATHSWTVTLTPAPMITDAFFSADNIIDVTLASDANPATNFMLSPTRPKAMAVTEITWHTPTVATLRLSTAAMPGIYTLTLQAPNGLTSQSGVAQNMSRVMFVTKATGTGDLSSWPLAGTGASGLAAGNRICQASAMAAGLGGNYSALLSTSTTDAYCNLVGAVGQMPCLGGSPGPWRRTDGTPIASLDGSNPLFSRNHLVPVRFDEYEDAVEDNAFAFMGTDFSGDAHPGTSTCSGWTSPSGSTDGYGASHLVDYTLFNYVGSGCERQGHLICVQHDEDGWPLSDAHERTGKWAFIAEPQGDGDLSSWPGAGGATGLHAADAVCAASAASQGLTGEFVAWMSNQDDDAYCRLAGFSGKRADACGQSVLPQKIGPWVRADGMLIAASLADLTDGGGIGEPLSFQADGSHVPFSILWTGTNASGESTGHDCNDWTSPSGSNDGDFGQAYSSGTDWTSTFVVSACDSASNSIYCFQR